ISQVIKPGECDIPTLQKQDTSTLRLHGKSGVIYLMEQMELLGAAWFWVIRSPVTFACSTAAVGDLV
ncbi:hypothetical protein ACC699_20480, partial [Rhizobium ruizarguesonis]